MIQTEITDTEKQKGEQFFLLKDGSLVTEDFYKLQKGRNPILLSRILEKIDFCKGRLLNPEELKDLEESLKFSAEGISLAWIAPGDSPRLVASPCTDKTVHVGPFVRSPWVVPVSFFRKDVLQRLSAIHQYHDRTDIFCRMTVQPVVKHNGVSFAKVSI